LLLARHIAISVCFLIVRYAWCAMGSLEISQLYISTSIIHAKKIANPLEKYIIDFPKHG